jgi:hypothetical protein
MERKKLERRRLKGLEKDGSISHEDAVMSSRMINMDDTYCSGACMFGTKGIIPL